MLQPVRLTDTPGTDPQRATLRVCCDRAILADGISTILQQSAPDLRVITCVQDPIALALDKAPDVLLLVSPVVTIDEKAKLAQLARMSKVILLTHPENAHRAVEALELGVRAVLSATCPTESLVHVVRTVVKVDALIMPSGSALHSDTRERFPALESQQVDMLTAREQEVLFLLSEGMSNHEIAQRLSVTDATIRSHVHHVLHKLGARSRAHAVALACRGSRRLHAVRPATGQSG